MYLIYEEKIKKYFVNPFKNLLTRENINVVAAGAKYLY
ncbi:hypothetical protein CSE_00410 [Caldisericum exile AZM16c01]|uniref:Uncharacterized protein n=1 Tax=Caldisericum exile (strain DSM 21853 / NBRC 104410 / AZM16c01) TaxID=511051 RepID=A0A7U6JGG0_CALEA|nr:hypothetical protein CSE_00410 [Caldisericum exile AZM16c01]